MTNCTAILSSDPRSDADYDRTMPPAELQFARQLVVVPPTLFGCGQSQQDPAGRINTSVNA